MRERAARSLAWSATRSNLLLIRYRKLCRGKRIVVGWKDARREAVVEEVRIRERSQRSLPDISPRMKILAEEPFLARTRFRVSARARHASKIEKRFFHSSRTLTRISFFSGFFNPSLSLFLLISSLRW